MVTDVYAHINNKDRQRLAVMVNENFFGKNERYEVYEKCTKDSDAATSQAETAPQLSPEISAIVEMLKKNEGMAAAMVSMLNCMI